MDRVELQVRIDSDHPKELTQPVVAFGDYTSKRSDVVIYGVDDLSKFFVDLICGRPLPTSLLLDRFSSLSDLLKIAFFVDREVVLHHKAPVLISAVELALALHEGGLAHIDRDLARLMLFLERYLLPVSKDKREQGRRLQEAVGWLRGYVLGDRLPNMAPISLDRPQVLDIGSNGFVVADTKGPMVEGLIELYRQGHLRGVLFSPRGPLLKVLAFRKTKHLRFDLDQAMQKINQAEEAMGDPPVWKVSEGTRLVGPSGGTRLPRESLLHFFLSI